MSSTGSDLSDNQKSVKGLLKAIVAGALIWVAINLVAMGYQPAHAESVIATVEIALSLVIVESLAREVSLTLVAAPLAALVTMAGNLTGMHPFLEPQGARAVWLSMHIVLSFVGIAAYATAAAAGTMYLVARRELKSAHFGAIFRFFPPLDTLDRVNHLASIAGFLGLTLGLALAAAYSFEYRALVLPHGGPRRRSTGTAKPGARNPDAG